MELETKALEMGPLCIAVINDVDLCLPNLVKLPDAVESDLATQCSSLFCCRCSNHRLVHTEEDVCFENEANLLLTAGSTPKKSPSLLQKMGLKLRKTTEYIGASNCAFEEE